MPKLSWLKLYCKIIIELLHKDVIKIKQMLLDGFGVENRFVACNGICIIDMWFAEALAAGHSFQNKRSLLFVLLWWSVQTHCHTNFISTALTVSL